MSTSLRRHAQLFVVMALLIAAVALPPTLNSAAATTASTTRSGDWSSASTWSTGSVPQPGQNVEISPGHNITFDSNATISRLEVKGTLDFSRSRSTELEVAGNIIVSNGGELLAGTPAEPVPAGITTTIRFDVQTSRMSGGHSFKESDTGLWVMSGGRWESHGAPVEHAWAKLDRDASSGSSTVIAQGNLRDWPVGSDILVTATGRNIDHTQGTTSFFTEDEERRIASVADNGGGTTRITLDSPLSYSHSGSGDARGEVALLSRNVVVTSKGDRRAHTMYMHGAKGSPSYTLFSKLGPKDVMGRYPVHLHAMGDTSIGMKITGNSIWDSENRWVVIHNSVGVEVEDNVAYRGLRTGFWLESTDAGSMGPEPTANSFLHNLAVKMTSLTKDDRRQSAFYAERGNHFIGNVAVSIGGSRDNSGFFWPEGGRSSTGHTFVSNETHSSAEHGIFGWQNSGEYHVVDFRTWRNTLAGVKWGAYQNAVQFHQINAFGNEKANFQTLSNWPFIQDSELRGESSYPTEDGLFIDHYTLSPSPNNPARTYRNVFSNHSGYDINHLSNGGCRSSCASTFNVIADTELNSANPIRFGSDWETRDTFFDIQGWDGNISGLPENFRLTRPDQSKPSSSAFKNSQMDAWVDPSHSQPSEWPMPPTIEWTSSPGSFSGGSATFKASASGFTTSQGDVEIFVDEFEDGTPWESEYYDNANLSGTPMVVGMSEINFVHRNESPLPGLLGTNNWSARYTKTFVSAGGEHEINLVSNDGARLYLDGKPLFDRWQKLSTCCSNRFNTKLDIPAGEHTLVIEYFDDTSDYAVLQFDLHRVVSGSSLSESLTIDAGEWPRKYAHVYARAHDPATGLFAYTSVKMLRNPEFSVASSRPVSGDSPPPDTSSDPDTQEPTEPETPEEPDQPEEPSSGGTSEASLFISESSNRSGAEALEGKSVDGVVYVFAGPEDDIRQVEFYIDDTSMNGSPFQLERSEPYDLAGGSVNTANGLATSELSDGSHSVTALVQLSGGSTATVTSSFTVNNGGDSSNPDSGTGNSNVSDDSNSSDTYSLLVSSSADRSGAVDLAGRSVSEDIYVFINPESGISRVDFWLNNEAMSGSPSQVENNSPYDMAGGSSRLANAFDTESLPDGSHRVTALVSLADGGSEVLTETFVVENDGGGNGNVANPDSGSHSLLTSSSPNRSQATELSEKTVQGDVYVFVDPEEEVRTVTFYMDDQSLNGETFQIENLAPYDMAGTGSRSANPFDTTQLRDGLHSVAALVELVDGVDTLLSATFRVLNR
ncbi:MAG: G8 domain-containing protein [Dehalococcoidia bacterium]